MSKKKLISTTDANWNIVIHASHLSFRYENEGASDRWVVKDFNFSFEQNLIYCICGASGSGKSTLVSHFNGLLKSKVGSIWVKDIYIDPKKRKIKNFKLLRKYVSMVFQFPEYQLFKSTIEKDIMFGPISLGVAKEIAKENARINLNKMGLDSTYLSRSPFDLSGGQKRRVAIAGVLAIDADVVIFDEPTAGLDPESENDMLKIILDEKKNGKTIILISHNIDHILKIIILDEKKNGKTIILISHNIDHILKIADCVLVMKEGELIASGRPYDIFTDDDLLSKAGLYKPYVIKMIDAFVQEDEFFRKLYDYQPNDLVSLANALKKILFYE